MCRLSLPQLERLAMATKALSFDVGDYVVYPKHGVGRVVELQSTEIAGIPEQFQEPSRERSLESVAGVPRALAGQST